MNKVEIQFTTSVDRLLSFCGHAVRFELEYMSKIGSVNYYLRPGFQFLNFRFSWIDIFPCY